MFKNQPFGLYVLSLANTGERFGYYTMLAIFLLFLQAKFGFDSAVSGQIYAGFLAAVYFMPLIGGWLADKWNFNKCVITGIMVMFAGYLIMAIPTGIRSTGSLVILLGALVLIAIGTGARDKRQVALTIGTATWIFALMAVVLTTVMALSHTPLALLMQTPPEALRDTEHYLLVCSLGIPFIMGYNAWVG